MKKSFVNIGVALLATAAVYACSSAPQSPTSPSAAAGGTTTAAADGSTLKATAPTAVSPAGGERVNSRRPTLNWTESTGRFESMAPSYEVQVSAGGSVVYAATVNGTSHEVANESELDTEYTWRVRARMDASFGPWSAPAAFLSPAPGDVVAFGSTGGPVGPPRRIGLGEAVGIIQAIYNAGGYRIGSGSSRGQRNIYIETAVAALHYGHGRWNPQGADSGWCIKNGGGGRPQSDEVLARCDSREAWDLVTGIGGPNPRWHPDPLGRLPGNQAIYPPRAEALNWLPQ